MDRRIIASALIALAIVAVAILASPANEVPSSSEAHVVVDGPEGAIWNGTVIAEPGTAFHALLAASEQGEFAVEWSEAFGTVYVSSVAGIDDARGGWCVQVDGADSPLSTDRFPVQDGQTVRWYWASPNCDRF